MNLDEILKSLHNPELQDPSDYHNVALGINESLGAEYAFGMIQLGLSLFPYDTDLLADALLFAPMWPAPQCFEKLPQDVKNRAGLDFGGVGAAEICFRLLIKNGCNGNWRAYTFAVDYLVDRALPTKIDVDDKIALLQQALELSDKFIEDCPKDERGYRLKSKVSEKAVAHGLTTQLGIDEADIEDSLKRAVFGKDNEKDMPAPQCCLRYMDMLLDQGRYEDVIRVAAIGIRDTAQSQPSASIGYFLYGMALAKDSLLIKNENWSGNACSDSIDNDDREAARHIIRLYSGAKTVLEGRGNFNDTIEHRQGVLRTLFNLKEDPSLGTVVTYKISTIKGTS